MSEKSLPQLPDDLSALAARLRGLRPVPAVTESPVSSAQAPRDRLMYHAGWAACETAHGWPADANHPSDDFVANAQQDVTEVGGVKNALHDITKPRRVSGRALDARTWAMATAALLLISLTLGGLLRQRGNESTRVAINDSSSSLKPLASSPQPLTPIPDPRSPTPSDKHPSDSSQFTGVDARANGQVTFPAPRSSLLAPHSSIPISSDNYLSLRTSVLLTGVEASAYRLPRPMATEPTHGSTKRIQQPTDYRSVLNSLLGG